MDPYEMNDMMKRLRNGEKEPCPICKKGIMIPVGDYKITHCFYCSSCKTKLNINQLRLKRGIIETERKDNENNL